MRVGAGCRAGMGAEAGGWCGDGGGGLKSDVLLETIFLRLDSEFGARSEA